MWFLLIMTMAFGNRAGWHSIVQADGPYNTEKECLDAEWMQKHGDMVNPQQLTGCVKAELK